MQSSRSVIRTGGGTDIAFAVVVLASYFTTFNAMQEATLAKIALMSVLGITYVALGIYGYGYCSRSNSLRLQLVYFSIQIPLGCWIVHLSQATGFNAMILLPLAGHSVMLLPRLWMLAANLGVITAYILPAYMMASGGETFWNGLQIFLAGQIFVLAFTQMAVNEERGRVEVERLVKDLESANQHLREYAIQSDELATTRERNRLAREIHDGLGHSLTTIHMEVQAAQAVMERNPQKAKELLNNAQQQSQEALADVRRSVSALRAAPEETLPLPESLASLLKSCEPIGIEAELKIIGEPRPLEPQVQLTFYRAVQEGINNAHKHARASNLWVIVDYSATHQIRLNVEDNGIGAENISGEGFGLLGIQERAHLLKGEFHFDTAVGQGFRFELTIPT